MIKTKHGENFDQAWHTCCPWWEVEPYWLLRSDANIMGKFRCYTLHSTCCYLDQTCTSDALWDFKLDKSLCVLCTTQWLERQHVPSSYWESHSYRKWQTITYVCIVNTENWHEKCIQVEQNVNFRFIILIFIQIYTFFVQYKIHMYLATIKVWCLIQWLLYRDLY